MKLNLFASNLNEAFLDYSFDTVLVFERQKTEPCISEDDRHGAIKSTKQDKNSFTPEKYILVNKRKSSTAIKQLNSQPSQIPNTFIIANCCTFEIVFRNNLYDCWETRNDWTREY